MIRRVLFGLMVIAQLAVPCWFVYSIERVANHGTLWRFKVQPIDPYDMFRGRYVRLGIEPNHFNYSGTEEFKRDQTVYAILDKDDKGFVRFSDLRLTKPTNEPFLKISISGVGAGNPDKNTVAVYLNLPVDRFYMNDKKAPEAEKYMRPQRGAVRHEAFLEVAILDGKLSVKELYVDNKPILEFLAIQ